LKALPQVWPFGRQLAAPELSPFPPASSRAAIDPAVALRVQIRDGTTGRVHLELGEHRNLQNIQRVSAGMPTSMGGAAIGATPRAVLFDQGSFSTRLDSACREFLASWHATPSEMPEIGPRVGFLQRRSNARAASALIDDLAAEIARLPAGERARRAWREDVRERLQQFGHDRLGWPDGYRRLLFGDHFYESAVAFVRDARAFDPGLPLEHVGQALRNVWIGNSFQMLLGRHVELRPGLFAYSMLYPVTDNWLDDPGVSNHAKRSFNERLGRRLAGLPVCPADGRDAAVGRLVERIEEECPRDLFPSVYASLLAIHDGQMRSLAQQGQTGLADADLLDISFRKGGSSVLTDLYLVTDVPQPLEERFAFGYGVFLQLLDDLQDIEADVEAGHETLFTRAARRGPLDEVAGRLACFIDTVLLRNGRFEGPLFTDRVDLIRRNCQALLVGSVAEQPNRFSRRFRRHLTRQWPVSFRGYRRLRRRAHARWRSAHSTVTGETIDQLTHSATGH
jgi:hypothetical protein